MNSSGFGKRKRLARWLETERMFKHTRDRVEFVTLPRVRCLEEEGPAGELELAKCES